MQIIIFTLIKLRADLERIKLHPFSVPANKPVGQFVFRFSIYEKDSIDIFFTDLCQFDGAVEY